MTKRRLLRLALDRDHAKLLRRRHARRDRASIKAVKDYVTASLKEAAALKAGAR